VLAPVKVVKAMATPNQLPLFHVVGFTGHRELEDPAGVAKTIRGELARLVRERPAQWSALSSIASGGDMLFAAAVVESGMRWHALLPMPMSMFREDFTPDEWAQAQSLLGQAAHVSVTSDNAEEHREHAYLDCGHETVNDSDVMIAVWDGKEARGIGGTAEVVAHARKLGCPLILINPATMQVVRERFDDFRAASSEVKFLSGLETHLLETPAAAPSGAPEALVRLQIAADKAAMAGSPKLRSLATMVIVFHSIAALIGTAILSFQVRWLFLVWGEAVFIGAGLIAALVYRRSFQHHSWIRCRLVAEISRAAIAIWGLPRTPNFLREIDVPGIHRLLASLRSLHSAVARRRIESLPEFREQYIRDRIDDQHAYYLRQKSRALPRLRWLRATFFTAATIGVGLTFANAILSTLGVNAGSQLAQAFGFDFLPVVLPALAAASVSIISINDYQRRVARYSEMIALLEVSRTQVAAAQTWSCLEREVNKCERLLLQEVLEWHTITSYSDAH